MIWLLKDKTSSDLHMWPVKDRLQLLPVLSSFFSPSLVCDSEFKDEANRNLWIRKRSETIKNREVIKRTAHQRGARFSNERV